MVSYSQAGQDLFVLELIKSEENKYFLDIGCWLPDNINNTFLLEQNGWNGISIDITDLSSEWKIRNTKFISSDALIIDYKKLFDENNSPVIIDYMNIDIEGDGLRYKTLCKVFESDRVFKIITIEHDDYRGYSLSEKEPQRKFLLDKGYFLICGDVSINGNSFEDWWINPKFFNENDYKHLILSNCNYNEIINKFKSK
jgi:hypothetical protein